VNFPIKLRGRLVLMDSTVDTDQDQPSFEPMLEVIEGDKAVKEPGYAIVPDAFEQVMAKYEGEIENFNEPIEPFYRNRFFIGTLCAFSGLMIGHFLVEPRVVEKVVTQEKPAVVATNTEAPKKPTVENVVKQPFRELKDIKEFDAWRPLNGGFPLPPKESQERLAGSITPTSPDFSSIPTSEIRGNSPRRGPLLPMDPGGIPSSLPDQNGIQEGTTNSGSEVTEPKKEEPKATVASEKFVVVSMNGPDPESGQSRLSGIASNLGGTARSFTHMSEEGAIESQCALMIIPAAKFQEAKSSIEKLGGASFDGEYNGVASRFQGVAQGRFTTRLAKLREKRKDLLVDFLEDAQPVKQITEAIDFESRAVSASRLGGNLSGKVVFLVMLK
jgi:hypothetical protein